MAKSCYYQENKLSPLLFAFIFTILGTNCIIGIIANGFIMAVNAAEWVRNKAVSASGRILFFLSTSRIALQSFVLLELVLAQPSSIYNQDVVYDTFKVSFIFLSYCSLWFAAWLSFSYFVKIADFSYPLFLKLKWGLSRWMSWILWLSVFISLRFSMLFIKGIFTVYCSKSFSIPSSNSTEKKYFTKTSVINMIFLYNLGICLPLSEFILAASLLITSLNRHAMSMESNATGSRDPSMQAHMGAIKAISYFLILYNFNAVALLLYMANIFDIISPWNILCRVIMAGYPAGLSVLLISDNPGLRRAWKQLQHRVHLYLKG
ncbi:LOW QUALITY PROTEIN: taste receptor type 2 member 39-like [Dugong dugon]